MIKFLAALKPVFFLSSKNCKSLIKLWQQYCTVEDISVMLSLMLPTILRTFLGTVPQGFQSLWFKDRAIFSKLALPLTWKKRSCLRQDTALLGLMAHPETPRFLARQRLSGFHCTP